MSTDPLSISASCHLGTYWAQHLATVVSSDRSLSFRRSLTKLPSRRPSIIWSLMLFCVHRSEQKFMFWLVSWGRRGNHRMSALLAVFVGGIFYTQLIRWFFLAHTVPWRQFIHFTTLGGGQPKVVNDGYCFPRVRAWTSLSGCRGWIGWSTLPTVTGSLYHNYSTCRLSFSQVVLAKNVGLHCVDGLLGPYSCSQRHVGKVHQQDGTQIFHSLAWPNCCTKGLGHERQTLKSQHVHMWFKSQSLVIGCRGHGLCN